MRGNKAVPYSEVRIHLSCHEGWMNGCCTSILASMHVTVSNSSTFVGSDKILDLQLYGEMQINASSQCVL